MNPESPISAIVLAAGASSRMGDGDKLLMPIAGKSILRRSVENAAKSKVRNIIVVTGRDIGFIKNELKNLNVTIVENRNAALGMSASLIAGIRAVDPDSEGVLILLADQPNLKPETQNRFIDKFQQTQKRIIAGKYGNVLGNPVLFRRSLFPELLQLPGDVGARSVLENHSDEIATLVIQEEEVLDVDTAEDFERMKSLLENSDTKQK